MLQPRTKSAFTLIELAIVLVIIGLLIGGVLTGRDLIVASEMRTVISDIDAINSAANTFKVKYDCLPGDCDHATDYFSGVTDGDGDARLNSAWWAGINVGPTNCSIGMVSASETFQFYYHLQQASLIRGTYTGTQGSGGLRHYIPGTNSMAAKFNPNIGYTVAMYPGDDAEACSGGSDFIPPISPNYNFNIIMFGEVQSSTCCETYYTGFTPATAFGLDQKMDDGLPASGKLIVYIPQAQQSMSGKVCVTDFDVSEARYALTVNDTSCGLTMEAGF